MHKDLLQDLLLFPSSKDGKLVSLKEYVDRMPEGQDKIYYAAGESIARIESLPQPEQVKDKGYEILYFTENVDEFAIRMMQGYQEKQFQSVLDSNLDLESEEEKKELEEKLQARKDEKNEQEELTKNIVEAANKQAGGTDSVVQAQQEIKDMMNKLKLVEDDVKGAAVDQGI